MSIKESMRHNFLKVNKWDKKYKNCKYVSKTYKKKTLN